MAKEFKLPYTAFEISDKLRTVDEVKADLENNYYKKEQIDASFDGVGEVSDDIYEALTTKADLIDGKVPLEQLPNNIGSGGGLTEVSWEDVKNKPFYDTRVISTYSYTENPNPVSFDCAAIGYSLYKISDLVLTKEEIFNANITINGINYGKYSQDNVVIETEQLLMVQYTNNGWAFCLCNTVGTCNFTFMGYSLSVDVPEVGIYRINDLGLGMSDISTMEIIVGGELKQIDPKFIPADLDFNLDDYYTKNEVYSKSEMDNLIGDIDTVLDEINTLIGE